MNDLNSVVIIGRLTRDAEVKILSSGYYAHRFSLAVNHRAKNRSTGQYEDKPTFIDIQYFTKNSLSPYLAKGKQVAVQGSIDVDEWTGKDGTKKSRLFVLAQSVQLLGSRSESQSDDVAKVAKKFGGMQGSYASQVRDIPVPESKPETKPAKEEQPSFEELDEEIPF